MKKNQGKRGESKKYNLESDKSKTDDRYQRENKELFKRMETQKNEMMMI